MVFERPGPVETKPLRLTDVPEPAAGPGELLLRLSACAVCRTDLQIVEGDIEARRLPVVPGHQAVGVVEAVGAGVSGWTAGEAAGVAWLGGTCGGCRFCLSGRENLCIEARFTGWDGDGGFAEKMTVRADFALRLPAGFEALAVAPLLCGGVIGYRALRRTGVSPGGRLGLYGFGASALLTMQVAVYEGSEVYVCTRSKAEQERALSMGAKWAGGYEEMPPDALDAAITFTPAGNVVVAALKALDRGGTVVVNAIHLDRVPEFSYDLLWLERNICSVANFTRRDASELLELAARIPIKTTATEYPLSEANEALADVKAGRVAGAAVLRTGD